MSFFNKYGNQKLSLSERMQQQLQERYADRPQPAIETDPDEFPSLTPSAIQIEWRTPIKFPHCPAEVGTEALLEYAQNLKPDELFAENQYGNSYVVEVHASESQLVVLTRMTDNVRDWAVGQVFIQNGKYAHKSEGTFFELDGAKKQFFTLAGIDHNISETFDDFC